MGAGAPEPDHDVDLIVRKSDADRAAEVLDTAGFEHYCDFGALLPSVRAVREQLDWDQLRAETADNDFAVVLLILAERLGLTG